MAKYFGKIGFYSTVEVKPGVWVKQITEREYFGDVLKNTVRQQSTANLNDNVVVSNQISVVSDPFANENFHSIIYVEYMGAKWKVSNVEVEYPRLKLSIGEVYNDDDGTETT